MISFRSLALAACLAALPLAGAVLPVHAEAAAPAETASAGMSLDELMEAASFDVIFTQFGATIAAAPAEQGMVLPGAMNVAWGEAAREVFDADAMHADLAGYLANQFDAEDDAVFADFYHSAFGAKVTEMERVVALLPPDQQRVAQERGTALMAEGSETRTAQVEEMLSLVSADITVAIVRQAIRGMMLGMSMSGQTGDIQVPWEEIDAQVELIMPGIEAELQQTQRAVLFFTYAGLGDDEFETYLKFLRTRSAQKLYAVGAYAVGEIITSRMEQFGNALARRLSQVNT